MAKALAEIFDSFTSVMELLRDPQFQYLLENYERAKRTFLVGYEVEDVVHSKPMFEAGGKFGLKPEDYLTAFAEFVKQRENEIEAISILLNRPGSWNTKVLNDLKKTLKENSFGVEALQKAHKVVYHKEVVDIISMVKHAAKETEPLLSPSERVNEAIRKVTYGKQLNSEQQQWMEYIKEHLKQNMTIDENDLKAIPVFADRGGFTRFRKVFSVNYKEIINEINTAIAA
jgi:type I restriction enzyme R subunit